MRKWIVFGVLFFCGWQIKSQEARVIALKADDASRARCTWERLQKAQREWAEVQESVKREYLTVPEGDKDASTTILSSQFTNRTYRRGFESGFEFSSDFKYIVPKPSTTTPPFCNTWYNGACGSTLFTPTVPAKQELL